jgi:hypothetical protein
MAEQQPWAVRQAVGAVGLRPIRLRCVRVCVSIVPPCVHTCISVCIQIPTFAQFDLRQETLQRNYSLSRGVSGKENVYHMSHMLHYPTVNEATLNKTDDVRIT